MPTAAILTIGNELISGDVADTNGIWLAQRLERIGVRVAIGGGPRRHRRGRALHPARGAPRSTSCLVTGGLGGTPDDLTREAIAAAFGVGQEVVPELADALRARFPQRPRVRGALGGAARRQPAAREPARRRARLRDRERLRPAGPPGRDGGHVRLDRARFAARADRLLAAHLPARESEIVGVLVERGRALSAAARRLVSAFGTDGPEVEIVLKSSDGQQLAAAADYVASALDT